MTKTELGSLVTRLTVENGLLRGALQRFVEEYCCENINDGINDSHRGLIKSGDQIVDCATAKIDLCDFCYARKVLEGGVIHGHV